MKRPFSFQLEAIDYGTSHNLYICDDCGLGKTLEAIEIVKAMNLQNGKHLVVCPKASRTQWQDAITEQIPDAQVIITDHLKYKFDSIDGWFITAFDELVPKSLLYPVAQVVWSTMIIDEAHRLKNYNTQKSKNITKIMASRKIALSATPVEQHGGQLWPILHWLDRETFGTSYWKWVKATFHVEPGFFGGVDIMGPKDQRKYQAQVMPYIMKRTKEMVAPQLPEKIEIPVRLQMHEDQQKVYDEIKKSKDILVQIEDKNLMIPNALSLFTRLHQISVLPDLLDFNKGSIKMDWLDDWLQDHRDMRVLVFSKYRGVVTKLKEMYDCCVVMQGINESDKFKKGNVQMIAGTIDAMSESLSFEMADAAIFLDQHWSSTKMTQAVDRIHRINITSSKLIYYLYASKEDYKVRDTIDGKLSEWEMLVDWVSH